MVAVKLLKLCSSEFLSTWVYSCLSFICMGYLLFHLCWRLKTCKGMFSVLSSCISLDKVNGCDTLFIMSVTNFSLCNCPEGDLSLHVTRYCRCCIKLTLLIQSEPN